jgi:hypothetical protein
MTAIRAFLGVLDQLLFSELIWPEEAEELIKTAELHQSERVREAAESIRCHLQTRDERPNLEKDSTGIRDPAAGKSRSAHVEDQDAQPHDRPQEHDHVPRSPFPKHQRSV